MRPPWKLQLRHICDRRRFIPRGGVTLLWPRCHFEADKASPLPFSLLAAVLLRTVQHREEEIKVKATSAGSSSGGMQHAARSTHT